MFDIRCENCRTRGHVYLIRSLGKFDSFFLCSKCILNKKEYRKRNNMLNAKYTSVEKFMIFVYLSMFTQVNFVEVNYYTDLAKISN